ncbi:MAG: SGNH/GDSL hydrolase family protein [Verrucomicrobiota bacterium]
MKTSPLFHKLLAATLLFFSIAPAVSRAEAPQLELKDNDVWVMTGDSITAQRIHTNYIEAYYRTRYPKLKLHFRNSGIGGNRVGSVLARFDYDVAAWKPTIVSVELGMNDANGATPSLETYIKGMKELIAKIRAIPAQPVLISSSPVDDGSIMGDWKSPRCQNINSFTEALKKLAEEEKVLFADQYHPLIDIWGQNRRKGAEEAAKSGALPTPPPATPTPTPGPDGKIPPAKPVKPQIPPSLIPLGGDTVHVGTIGQYNMAAAILKELKAGGEVSSATIGADGKVVESTRCKITDVSAKDGKLSFTRLDEAGPWSIPPKADAALKLLPDTLNLSQYLLRVTGLPEGQYRVSINGEAAGSVSAKDLNEGWNLTTVTVGFLAKRAQEILALINKLQSPLNQEWRAASKANDPEKLAVRPTIPHHIAMLAARMGACQ